MSNNEIISFEVSKRPTYEAISIALKQAIVITSDCLYRRTFHSDQGWAYQMHQYTDKLKAHRIFQSMSRTGNCYGELFRTAQTRSLLWSGLSIV